MATHYLFRWFVEAIGKTHPHRRGCYKLLQPDTPLQCFQSVPGRHYACHMAKPNRKTTMKQSTKIISAIVLTIGVAGGAAAYDKYGNSEKRADFMVSYISDELELDATQSQALEVLKDQLVSARHSVKEEAEPMKAKAFELLNAETFDRAQALEMITTKTSAVNEQAPEIVNALGDFLDTLNSQQKEEITEFLAEHRGHRGHFKHRR